MFEEILQYYHLLSTSSTLIATEFVSKLETVCETSESISNVMPNVHNSQTCVMCL